MTATRLTRVHVAGFRSLRDVTLDLGAATLLIGANGAGKSNLLSLLRMVALMRTRSLRRFVGEQGGASALLHYGAATTRELSFTLSFTDARGPGAYAVRLGHAAGDSLVFLDERFVFDSLPAPVLFGDGHAESLVGEHDKPLQLTFFHFHDTSSTSPLRQNSAQSENTSLQPFGGNLAAFLYRLRHSRETSFQHAWNVIESLVQRVAPYIKTLEPALVAPESANSAVRLYWTDQRDHRFDVHDLSDGTLRAIALFTALAQPEETLPQFIAIDEPELGLHPAALSLFAELVHSVSARCQVLLSTQSPALLDQFEAKDVVVVEQKDGESSFRHLDEVELRAWLEAYSLSDLFNKNVLGGRP
jgi:predicted ATPase